MGEIPARLFSEYYVKLDPLALCQEIPPDPHFSHSDPLSLCQAIMSIRIVKLDIKQVDIMCQAGQTRTEIDNRSDCIYALLLYSRQNFERSHFQKISTEFEKRRFENFEICCTRRSGNPRPKSVLISIFSSCHRYKLCYNTEQVLSIQLSKIESCACRRRSKIYE
jgi:hypothetical protein